MVIVLAEPAILTASVIPIAEVTVANHINHLTKGGMRMVTRKKKIVARKTITDVITEFLDSVHIVQQYQIIPDQTVYSLRWKADGKEMFSHIEYQDHSGKNHQDYSGCPVAALPPKFWETTIERLIAEIVRRMEGEKCI